MREHVDADVGVRSRVVGHRREEALLEHAVRLALGGVDGAAQEAHPEALRVDADVVETIVEHLPGVRALHDRELGRAP